MMTISNVAEIGPDHADIDNFIRTNGKSVARSLSLQPNRNSVPTYPCCGRMTRNARTMMLEADSEGQPQKRAIPKERGLIDLKVESVWKTASHCHFNRDFRFNS